MMKKQNGIIRTLIIAAMCVISLCAFRMDASAEYGVVEEDDKVRGYDMDGFPLVYTGDWLFQIKANEAVIIAYLGDKDKIETPLKVKMANEERYFEVKAIGTGAFSQNSNANFSKAKKRMANTIVGSMNHVWKIKEIKINSKIDTIGDSAFLNNTEINYVRFDTSDLLYFGSSAFCGCTGIVEFTIPECVKVLGSSCFKGCTNLRGTIEGSTGTGTMIIPARIEEVPDSCFESCISLTNVKLMSGVIKIGGRAFYECESLVNINMPDKITSIGSSAFEYCTAIRAIHIPTGITTISSRTFAHCNVLENVVVPTNVTSIGSYAFAYRVYGLEYEFDFNVPNEFIKVKPVILNEGLKRIDSNAFYDIPIMRIVLIPYSVENIGTNAFGYYESKAGTRSIPKFKIQGYYDTEAEEYAQKNNFEFIGSANVGAIIESNDAQYVTTETKGEVTLSHIDQTSATSYTVPKTIKNGKKTYTVTAIGDNAFKDCKLLKTVTIGEEVKTIGKGAFKGCRALESVTTGDKVTTIGDEAFYGCKLLKEVTLEKGVTTIGKKAFFNCKKLEKVTILSKKLKKIGSKAFKGIYKKADFKVPGKKLKTYKKKIKKAGAPKSVSYGKVTKTK
ncbi:leucine-rich repeat domain-containing protein [Butyrivibrio sp. AE3004]|uniref:leucine-rich repeat domain-containing protein n=1 Tax=Butyrivibrio sp. AE3004 TaxID=1506994 RepID=UPI00049461FA|nr:leucine-rich repeat domain-containing protein [Butyrivibrio sp. AE3004]